MIAPDGSAHLVNAVPPSMSRVEKDIGLFFGSSSTSSKRQKTEERVEGQEAAQFFPSGLAEDSITNIGVQPSADLQHMDQRLHELVVKREQNAEMADAPVAIKCEPIDQVHVQYPNATRVTSSFQQTDINHGVQQTDNNHGVQQGLSDVIFCDAGEDDVGTINPQPGSGRGSSAGTSYCQIEIELLTFTARALCTLIILIAPFKLLWFIDKLITTISGQCVSEIASLTALCSRTDVALLRSFDGLCLLADVVTLTMVWKARNLPKASIGGVQLTRRSVLVIMCSTVLISCLLRAAIELLNIFVPPQDAQGNDCEDAEACVQMNIFVLEIIFCFVSVLVVLIMVKFALAIRKVENAEAEAEAEAEAQLQVVAAIPAQPAVQGGFSDILKDKASQAVFNDKDKGNTGDRLGPIISSISLNVLSTTCNKPIDQQV
jgi:hypothetical protein